MLPTRPDVNVYVALSDELADYKSELSTLEYELEKAKAHAIKDALNKGEKTRAIDYIKVIGYNPKDEVYFDGLKKRIIELNRSITITYGKMEAWKSSRDLYRTDSYHQVTGRMGYEREENND